MLGLLAKKVGMTQVFDTEGNAVPVTVLELLENKVTQKKTSELKDGYDALQIGSGELKESKLNKAEIGHLKSKLGEDIKYFGLLKEFRADSEEIKKYEVGSILTPEEVLGEEGTLVDITSRPKGKGTTGRIKRWSQHRRNMTHGAKHHRQIGSAGAGTTPGHVIKGKRMPGRDSNKVTISHSLYFKYDKENRIILVKGAVPGHKGSIVCLKKSLAKKDWNKSSK